MVVASRLTSLNRSRLFGLGTAWMSRSCRAVVAVGNRCHAGGWHIVHEAARLETCPPLLFTVHVFFSAARWENPQLFADNLQCTMVATVPLGASCVVFLTLW